MRRITITARLLSVGIAAVLCGGCVLSGSQAQETARRVSGAESGHPVTSAELDELSRAFADRYVGLLYSACDILKKDNEDAAQRREAQTLLLDCSTNIYDIASNADAFTRVLDLLVVTSLINHVWVDGGRAAAIFGERGGTLTIAMSRASAEARALAARVLTADQLDVIDALLVDWWKENPEMVRVSFIRFSNFAIGRGMSAVSNVLDARGQFAQIEQASQAVDEARLLGERMFYRLKREPTLLRWQIEAMKEDFLATPKLATVIDDMQRLVNQVEQLPANVASERQAIFAGFDSSLQGVNSTVANARVVMAEAKSFLAAMEPAGESLNEMLNTADVLLTRFDAWDRWNTAAQPQSFDIRAHAETAREVAAAAQNMNALVTTLNHLLASPDWKSRVNELHELADGRIILMTDQSRIVLDALFWRICALLGVVFAMFIMYRLFSALLVRRPANREGFAGSGA